MQDSPARASIPRPTRGPSRAFAARVALIARHRYTVRLPYTRLSRTVGGLSMRRLLGRRSVQILIGAGLMAAGCAELSPIQWEEMKADLSQKDRRSIELEDALARRERFLARAQ